MFATSLLSDSTILAAMDVPTRLLNRIGIFMVVVLVIGLIRAAARAGR